MIVLLDGKGAKAALPDVAAGVVVLAAATDMGGQQPADVGAQVAVVARSVRLRAANWLAGWRAFRNSLPPFNIYPPTPFLAKNRWRVISGEKTL
jgi:hypothetical protein